MSQISKTITTLVLAITTQFSFGKIAPSLGLDKELAKITPDSTEADIQEISDKVGVPIVSEQQLLDNPEIVTSAPCFLVYEVTEAKDHRPYLIWQKVQAMAPNMSKAEEPSKISVASAVASKMSSDAKDVAPKAALRLGQIIGGIEGMIGGLVVGASVGYFVLSAGINGATGAYVPGVLAAALGATGVGALVGTAAGVFVGGGVAYYSIKLGTWIVYTPFRVAGAISSYTQSALEEAKDHASH